MRAQAEDGTSVLHMAAAAGHYKTVRMLVHLGADVHRPTRSGATALHYAAKKGCLEVIVVLTDLGSKVLAQDSSGCTPLHNAASAGKVRNKFCVSGKTPRVLLY